MSDTSQSTQHAEGSGIAQAQGPGAIANVITNIFRGGTAEQRALRNRQAMLQLVQSFWVKGVLEQSLHGAAMIELGLEERAEAVERPWDMVLQTPDQPNRPLPPGTRIVDVFDEMNRTLLILGEPGSGKTTMLLELARDTIARAEQDPMQPIPVVFNLSSWAEKRPSLTGWLMDELNTRYYVPKRIARSWVENDDLSLLLDGLDEVRAGHRGACVEAINDFRREHGLTSLAVCSRIADYEVLTTKLEFQGAVLLQLLTPQQIEKYLAGSGTELSAVRETLQDDTALQELAQTPLMLSIMTLAYRGLSAEGLQVLDTIAARRKHLFDAYVQRMFEQRRIAQPYSPEQTIHWLTWLAQKMTQHAQTVFLIERMQPSWLQTREPAKTLKWPWTKAIGWLRVLLFLVTLVVLRALLSELLFVLFGGLLFGLLVGLRAGLNRAEIEARTVHPAIRQPVKHAVIIGLLSGLLCGLLCGLLGVLLLWLPGEGLLGAFLWLFFVHSLVQSFELSRSEMGIRDLSVSYTHLTLPTNREV